MFYLKYLTFVYGFFILNIDNLIKRILSHFKYNILLRTKISITLLCVVKYLRFKLKYKNYNYFVTVILIIIVQTDTENLH